jgi:hypothetical protein
MDEMKLERMINFSIAWDWSFLWAWTPEGINRENDYNSGTWDPKQKAKGTKAILGHSKIQFCVIMLC